MPIRIERPRWILYKHTSDFNMIKQTAFIIKRQCISDISHRSRQMLQRYMSNMDLYCPRNSDIECLDAMNHRINTLEFYMFGYEDHDSNKFIFSPLGNLFLENVSDDQKTRKIFVTMLFGIQYQHYANTTPRCFQLYPFRLLFQLLSDERLNNRIYSAEYAYIIQFEQSADNYNCLVDRILQFRKLNDGEQIEKLQEDQHASVVGVYEWQYYTQKILESAGIINVVDEGKLCKLCHPQNPGSHSKPTYRIIRKSYCVLSNDLRAFVSEMLTDFPCTDRPYLFSDDSQMQMDVVKEIYSFYPRKLLIEIGYSDDDPRIKLLELPKLIEKYAENENNETAYLFEDILAEGFDMFYNVRVRQIGGSGNTDIECMYVGENVTRKFAVDGKSTAHKLPYLSAGRLQLHREKIGAKYTIVVTPRYVPSVKMDIRNDDTVLLLASTFSEYLYNHFEHQIREMDYSDFDEIIMNNLGTDVSKLISELTLRKFAMLTKNK